MSGQNSKSSGDREPLDPEEFDRLGKKIREAYSDVLDAPLPDRFIQLLDQLDKSEQKKKSGTS